MGVNHNLKNVLHTKNKSDLYKKQYKVSLQKPGFIS